MESSDKVPTFNPVGSYQWPVRPTEQSLRRLAGELWRTFRRQDEPDPFISDDSLRWTSRSRLNHVAAPPACGPLLQEMDATFSDWIVDDEPSHWLQLVVFPPCDQNEIVRSWASVNDHVILEPPPRDTVLNCEDDLTLPEIEGNQVLVVPRLEHWFLRHRTGLGPVRKLMKQLTELEQHCVIGCNSWGWGFLSKTIGSDASVPCGLTFESFHASRLRDWFYELASEGEDHGRTFRLSLTGEDVFAGVDDDSEPSHFFEKLSARSLGIPWVAWHLWRRTLRLGPDEESGVESRFPGEQTLWIAALDDFELPKKELETAFLILHALLIHDALNEEQLHLVIPTVSEANILPSLVNAGFVLREDSLYRCSPAAYPAIRARLNDAGFPMDEL